MAIGKFLSKHGERFSAEYQMWDLVMEYFGNEEMNNNVDFTCYFTAMHPEDQEGFQQQLGELDDDAFMHLWAEIQGRKVTNIKVNLTLIFHMISLFVFIVCVH